MTGALFTLHVFHCWINLSFIHVCVLSVFFNKQTHQNLKTKQNFQKQNCINDVVIFIVWSLQRFCSLSGNSQSETTQVCMRCWPSFHRLYLSRTLAEVQRVTVREVQADAKSPESQIKTRYNWSEQTSSSETTQCWILQKSSRKAHQAHLQSDPDRVSSVRGGTCWGSNLHQSHRDTSDV